MKRSKNDDLTLSEARGIALAAQGFDRPRPRRAAADDLRRVIRQLGLVQLDFVNVLVPAHYLVLFSRLGPYDRSLFDEVVYRRREFTEQWAHEASIVPVETWPLLAYRRESHRVRPWGFETFLEQHPDYAGRLLELVRERGALTAETLPAHEGTHRRIPGGWVSVPRAVLEAHFGRGVLAVAGRQPNFARAYDLAERVIPPEYFGARVEREMAERELLLRAARSHGVGTAGDLADYYRMPVRDARLRIAELVEDGAIREVRVEGWREAAYLHAEVRPPRGIRAAALLAPFDPVVWFRARVSRLFGFDYRFEIFVPQAKRRWGCYVLPFLLGDRLAARVDLKADRTGRRLLVVSARLEDGCDRDSTAAALARELRALADWLALGAVVVEGRGGFARPLGAAVRAG